MPKELIEELKKIRVAGQQLNISKLDENSRRAATDDTVKRVDKSKKRISSTSRRAKPKEE